MKKENTRDLENQLYIAGLCLPGVIAVFFIMQSLIGALLPKGLYPPCVLYAVTGFYCPGCGGTRACAALLDGKFLLSFCYHPVVPYCGALYAWFMVSHTAERLICRLKKTYGKGAPACPGRVGMTYRNIYLYIALALAVINIAAKDIALAAFHVDILKILDAHVLI